MRTVDSLSTLRDSPSRIVGRRDGSVRSTSRSTVSRSSGTAAISEWTAALTSVHHACAAVFAAVRSPPKSSAGTTKSDLA